jgi:hypothetical protein
MLKTDEEILHLVEMWIGNLRTDYIEALLAWSASGNYGSRYIGETLEIP